MALLPNIPAKTFTLSACVVGFILINDLDDKEQNALGNWLMLVAQVLCTNAFYKQLQESKKIENLKTEDVINMINKMKKALEKELNDLKNNESH